MNVKSRIMKIQKTFQLVSIVPTYPEIIVKCRHFEEAKNVSVSCYRYVKVSYDKNLIFYFSNFSL